MPLVNDIGGAGRRAFEDSLRTSQATEKEIRDILRSAMRDAGREIRKLPGNTYSEQVRRAQYDSIRSVLRQINAESWQDIQLAIESGTFRSKLDAARGTGNLVNALGDGVIPRSQLEQFVNAAEQSVERMAASLTNRYPLSQSVYKNAALSAGKVDQAVNNGLVLGKSAREIAADVMRFIDPNVPGGQSYAAMRLARTEIQNAFHETSKRAYARQPWVLAVHWNLSGSHPRHDICNDYGELDQFGLGVGNFPNGQCPVLPHPHCLCSVTAVTPNQDDFIDNLLGGNYDAWLESEGLAPIR